MYFYYGNSKEEIRINFKVCDESINTLIEDGYLEEEFETSDFESNEFNSILSDAVIDCLADIAAENDFDETIVNPESVDSIIYAIGVNYYFCQFASWNWIN